MKIFFSKKHFILISFFVIAQLVLFKTANAAPIEDAAAVIGRWDLTVSMDNQSRPSWLEVYKSGTKTLVGQFVGTGGSARPISKVQFENGKFSFSIPPQWESGNDIIVEGTVLSDSISGTITAADGKKYSYTGVRAPKLKRTAEPVWQQQITLFDGKDLNGWHASGQKNQWVAKDGILQSASAGSNIISDQTFTDFKLHIEFRYPKGSNSGVYLRGRYEVQIEDDHGDEPYKDVFSSIYGFLEPTEMAAKNAGEWQTYDITLVGRMVTIVANGKTVICNREIPGITGGALDSKEDEPGPIYLQGDHMPIEYRNIIITPAK